MPGRRAHRAARGSGCRRPWCPGRRARPGSDTLRPRAFYAVAMTGPLIFIATNRLKAGALNAERSRVPELVRFVEREEPQVIGFNEYVIADHARRAYEETLDRTVRIQVFGDVPEPILASLREQASAGVEIIVNAEHLGGFLRTESGAGRV